MTEGRYPPWQVKFKTFMYEILFSSTDFKPLLEFLLVGINLIFDFFYKINAS